MTHQTKVSELRKNVAIHIGKSINDPTVNAVISTVQSYTQQLLDEVEKEVICADEVQDPWTFANEGDKYITETVRIKTCNKLKRRQRQTLQKFKTTEIIV